jgi:thymidylate kinase
LRQPARNGVSLALLGPDGAGKSTAARQVVEAYPFPATVIYMGIGGPPGKRRRRLPALIAMTAIGLMVQWRRYLAGRLLQLRGHLVVFDRYMEEIWLPQPSEASGIRRAGRRLRRALSCPPADVMIVLDSPGALMFERKAEHDPSWLESERQRYLQLAERMPGVVVVDNTRPQHQLIRDINAILWARLRARLAGAFRHR